MEDQKLSQPRLFLGFHLNNSFTLILEEIDVKKRELFIKEKDPLYLQKISHKNDFYLGKFIKEISTLDDLLLLEKNIATLLVKLSPKFSTFDISFLILPIFNAGVK